MTCSSNLLTRAICLPLSVVEISKMTAVTYSGFHSGGNT